MAVPGGPRIADAIPYAFSRVPISATWLSGFSDGAGIVVLTLYAVVVIVWFACVNAAFCGELLKAQELSLAAPASVNDSPSGDHGWRNLSSGG